MSGHGLVEVDPFRALANSDRREILQTLRRAPENDTTMLSIGKIAAAVELTRFAASRHLRILEASGLVTSQRDGMATLYALRMEGMTFVDDWLADFFVLPQASDSGT